MIRNIVVGIDIGTWATRVVVCEYMRGEKIPRVIGLGSSETKGVRHGYVINSTDVTRSVRKAVADAEKNSGVKIKRAYVSVSGTSLSSQVASGNVIISKADNEVTALDITKAIAEAEEALNIVNKKVIDAIPVFFKLDGKEIYGRPEGMKGVKLEVKTLFITCLSQHLDELIGSITNVGIEVIDVVPAALAASRIALTERQKTVGCVLVNIGAETVSLAVFENNALISLHVFPIGSTDITNDIALGLRIPLDEAEGLKVGSIIGNYSKKKLDEIIEARLVDIFELIENHLKKLKRSELLPAGVVLTGGGSQIALIEELSKSMLKLPTKIGSTDLFASSKNKMRDSSWFVALGLCLVPKGSTTPREKNEAWSAFKDFFKGIGKQLMP